MMEGWKEEKPRCDMRKGQSKVTCITRGNGYKEGSMIMINMIMGGWKAGD